MLVWFASLALAGGVYVNGTYVEPRSMAGVNLAGATVRFDDQGNVHISAPGYKIQVADGVQPASTTRPPVISPPKSTSGVAYGRWWVVTEDQGSKGHLVDVYINGTLAATIRSGQGTQLVELSKWLKLGSNEVVLRSTSTNPGGGALTVFAGAGGTEKGHFDMPSPSIEYGLGAGKTGTHERKYTITVDR